MGKPVILPPVLLVETGHDRKSSVGNAVNEVSEQYGGSVILSIRI